MADCEALWDWLGVWLELCDWEGVTEGVCVRLGVILGVWLGLCDELGVRDGVRLGVRLRV